MNLLFLALKTLKWLLILTVLLTLTVTAYIHFHPTFGGKPDAASLAKIRASEHYNGTLFQNLEPTELITPDGKNYSTLAWLLGYFTPPEGKNPATPLPSEPLRVDKLEDGRLVWFGHSTVLFQMAGKRLITDPVFYRATPLPFGGKPFPQSHPTLPADLPPLDAVLISHDHYDHLDYRAIRELDEKVGHYYVPLGVKAHLQRWGIADEKITEMDWFEAATLGDIRLTLAPARHFSGRNFINRNRTLWGSWVVQSPAYRLFYNGDSGYGAHFADIGKRFGPFDIVLMENGAYNTHWANIHMKPEQSVQAAVDVGAQTVLPIHWAKFDLSNHTWQEPIERFRKAAAKTPLTVATPYIGEVFDYREPPQRTWWQDVP